MKQMCIRDRRSFDVGVADALALSQARSAVDLSLIHIEMGIRDRSMTWHYPVACRLI
nr:hypothetical protein [Pseudomonas sp. HS-2]